MVYRALSVQGHSSILTERLVRSQGSAGTLPSANRFSNRQSSPCDDGPMTVRRAYGGVSADDRRLERRERLMDAAFDLLADGGSAALTVTGVCKRARLSERYFYESFADRNALVEAAFERLAAAGALTIAGAVDSAPNEARARARAVVDALVTQMHADERLESIVAQIDSDALLLRTGVYMSRALAAAVEHQAGLFWNVSQTTSGAVHTASLLVIGGIAEIVTAWLKGELGYSREELVDRCADFFVVVGETLIDA